MKVKSVVGATMVWVLLVPSGFSVSKPLEEMITRERSDTIAPDEEPARYPALDLEELCKNARNPRCEPIVDSFCIKACRGELCSTHGSIRGMCRLMCEAEDLPPPCSKMGPSQPMGNTPYPQWSFQYPYSYPQG